MGLRLEIDSDIKSAFDTDLADAVTPFTAIRQIKTDDDWLENGNSYTETTYQGRGVFGNFNQTEIDGQSILISDIKLICLQSETTDTPAVDDVINDYQVVSVKKDPANVSFTIQLRKV
ncbi:glutamate 5-kinase [Faucicola mancuniensis]|uniref:glutamate 5-kinase n=1 Tax=Faucicola mancuniensis TaxID=1309795 RepID=UPI003977A412